MNITVQDLKKRLDNQDQITLIDVRESYEHEEFNIGGSLIPLGELPAKIPDLDVEKQADVVVYCRSGNRSMMGHLLKEAGYTNDLISKVMLAWQEHIK